MLALNYKTILGVALPMMVTGFIQSIVLLTDASLIARYSTDAFDAVGNAGLLYVTLFMCLAGMADAVVVGSRLIDAITDAPAGEARAALLAVMKDIRAGVDQASAK